VKKRVVLTGGPGGGKTTALDLFRRELGNQVSTVPEAATMLFSGGVERVDDEGVIKAQQLAIINLQKNLQDIKRKQHPDRLVICDRGTLDGLAYWPGADDEFFELIDSSKEYELSQYDAVIFFETAAKSGQGIKSNNPIRNESEEKAIELDKKLQTIWSAHPNYHFVESSESFIKKIMLGILTIKKVLKKLESEKN
jgi:predicted ATPase